MREVLLERAEERVDPDAEVRDRSGSRIARRMTPATDSATCSAPSTADATARLRESSPCTFSTSTPFPAAADATRGVTGAGGAGSFGARGSCAATGRVVPRAALRRDGTRAPRAPRDMMTAAAADASSAAAEREVISAVIARDKVGSAGGCRADVRVARRQIVVGRGRSGGRQARVSILV